MQMRAACLAASLLFAALMAPPTPAAAQEGEADPPTTLPFAPTVRSAPPSRPTYPERSQPAQPPEPADPVCTDIGPVIRAGVNATRFASLSPSTAEGAVIGRFSGGEGIAELGGDYCTVVIPGAEPLMADAAYNQVTCPLAMEQGDVHFLEDMRTRRAKLAKRIGACPSMALWTGTPPAESPLTEPDITEDFIFSHPDVAVEILVRARHHTKAGQWPYDHVRTLSLVFRTPNPDRPDPPEPEESEEPGPDSATPAAATPPGP